MLSVFASIFTLRLLQLSCASRQLALNSSSPTAPCETAPVQIGLGRVWVNRLTGKMFLKQCLKKPTIRDKTQKACQFFERPMAFRAVTMVFHRSLALASFRIVFQLLCKPLISVSVVNRHVFLGLPRLRPPSGCQCGAVRLGDGFSFLSEDMANLPPAPSHDDAPHKQIFVGNDLSARRCEVFFADFWCGRSTAIISVF